MSIGAAFLAWVACGAAVQDDSPHQGTFDEALEHHSGTDLRKWREAHPWSLGDRLAGFFEGLLATRKAGEPIAVEHKELEAAFLAESLAEDPFSGWIMEVHGWDTEACARNETVLSALAGLPATIAAGEGDAAWSAIADLRDHVAPSGCWALGTPELARCAAAFLHAGQRERARDLATAVATRAEALRQGSVLSACERVLGELALEDGDLASAERRASRSFELRTGLDSGARGALPDEIERLDRCDLDTLLEIAVGEKQTLLVAAGPSGRTAISVPVGREAVDALARRIFDRAGFDEAAASELHGKLLGPVEGQLGLRVGIVLHTGPPNLPFEASLGRDHSIVRLSRPPLGGAPPVPPPSAGPASSTIVVAGEAGAAPSPVLRRIAPVRSIDAKSLLEILKGSAGARWIHVESVVRFDPQAPELDPKNLKGVHLDAELLVFANARPGSKADVAGSWQATADALHSIGVRDVVASLWTVEPAQPTLLLRFYDHLARGEPAADALRSARSDLIDGLPAEGLAPAGPRQWAAWVLHRRD